MERWCVVWRGGVWSGRGGVVGMVWCGEVVCGVVGMVWWGWCVEW